MTALYASTALAERHATDDAGFERVRRWACEASERVVAR